MFQSVQHLAYNKPNHCHLQIVLRGVLGVLKESKGSPYFCVLLHFYDQVKKIFLWGTGGASLSLLPAHFVHLIKILEPGNCIISQTSNLFCLFSNLLLIGAVNNSMRASTPVVELIDTTALGIAENERFANRPSARSTRRLPFSVQMMWSTLERTFSHKISGVLKLDKISTNFRWKSCKD